jgi:hypothetical protein
VLPIPSLDLNLGIDRSPLAPLDRSTAPPAVPATSRWPRCCWLARRHCAPDAGLEVIVPTGSYDASSPVNTGRKLPPLAALYGVTWLPGRWEASAGCATASTATTRDRLPFRAWN